MFFKGKRLLAPRLSEPDIAPPAKKPVPRHVFINQARKRKQAAASGPSQKQAKPMSDTGPGELTVEGAGDGEPAAAAVGGTSSGGAGGGGGKSGGVGHSTGQYDNRTLWKFLPGGEVEITCYSTRMIHQNMPSEEIYRTVFYKTRGNGFSLQGYGYRDDAHVQVTTPWSLVDCNAWGVWFCPSDFQHLINTCDELRIVSLEQDIFNMVIKTVTEIGPADARVKQYANDLTASMMIAEDSNNILPYTPAAMRMSTVGFLPWKPCNLPTYSYYSDWTGVVRPSSINNHRNTTAKDTFTEMVVANGRAAPTHVYTETIESSNADAKRRKVRAVEQIFSQNTTTAQFYCIETQIPITMIRTGDSWSSGSYKFNCMPMNLTYNWQSQRQLGMPPKGITLPSTSTADLTMPQPAARRGRYWGQGTSSAGHNIWESTVVRPTTLGYQFPEWVFMDTGGGPAVNNGPLGNREVQNAPYWTNGAHSYVYQHQHGSLNGVGQWTTSGVGTGATPWTKRATWIQKNMNSNQVQTGEFLGIELTPDNTNAVDARVEMGKWLPHTLNTYSPYTSFKIPSYDYPWGQIWDKRPDVEIKAKVQPTAPFLVDNPPGQILTRLAPNLTETYDANSASYSRIVTYADYWWKGKLTFRAKLRVPSQWNLHQFCNTPPTQTTNDLRLFMPDSIGQISLPHLPTQYIHKKVY